MSMPKTERITCPNCCTESDFTTWESINTDLSPDIKDRIITGDLFRFTCPHCGMSTTVLYPFLYHDMGKHCMMTFDPREDGDTADTAGFNVFPFSLPDYSYRSVRGMDNLIEKILVLNDNLDDHCIEYLKLVIFQTHKLSARYNRFVEKSGVKNLAFCIIDEEGYEKKSSQILIPLDSYDYIYRQMKNLDLLDDGDSWPEIDRKWALANFKKIKA